MFLVYYKAQEPGQQELHEHLAVQGTASSSLYRAGSPISVRLGTQMDAQNKQKIQTYCPSRLDSAPLILDSHQDPML